MGNRNLLVGIFIVAGLALFVVGIFLVGDGHQAFAHHVEFYSEFSDLSGLTTGSKVRVGGMDAGQVVAILVPTSPSSKFRVRLRINEKMHVMVRNDSLVTIDTAGVVGETFLAVHPGSSAASEALPLSTLPSKGPVEISALLDKGLGVLDDADGTIKQVGGKLNGTLDGITTAVGNANDLLVGLKRGRGPVGMLLTDKTMETQIRGIVTNAQQATANVNHASAQADTLISDIESRHLPQRVDNIVDSVNDTTSQINQSAVQVHQSLTKALGPDPKGIDAAQNINDSLSNLNTATGNMSEDAEALKHNFFFRGFFRNRGYYNLTSIPPEEYRRDRLFASIANYRAWLSASELFAMDNNKVETLSPKGKKLLDNSVAQYGESLLGSPLVIEGYSNAPDPAQQIALSYSRAIMVRHYLEIQFHLDAKNVGVISLKDVPPSGLGHNHWDGICVVVPNGRR
jgi:phospholipid/cholesterol/gamma-HCH transport system substrate-binding protein